MNGYVHTAEVASLHETIKQLRFDLAGVNAALLNQVDLIAEKNRTIERLAMVRGKARKEANALRSELLPNTPLREMGLDDTIAKLQVVQGTIEINGKVARESNRFIVTHPPAVTHVPNTDSDDCGRWSTRASATLGLFFASLIIGVYSLVNILF